MNEAYNRALEQLNRDFPGKRQSLTLHELCEVIPTKLKTLQNQKSNGTLGFPVTEVGGQVLVSKETAAKLIAGLNPNEEFATDNKVQDGPEVKASEKVNAVISQEDIALALNGLSFMVKLELKRPNDE